MPDLRSLVLGRLEIKVCSRSELAAGIRAPESDVVDAVSKLRRRSSRMRGNSMGGKSPKWVGRKRADMSLEHSACVLMLGEILKEAGIPRSIHDCQDIPDLIAECGGERVAIEYETGKRTTTPRYGRCFKGAGASFRGSSWWCRKRSSEGIPHMLRARC